MSWRNIPNTGVAKKGLQRQAVRETLVGMEGRMNVSVNLHAKDVSSVTAHRTGQYVFILFDTNGTIHLSLETIAKLESALIEAKVLCHEAEGERIAAQLLASEVTA